MKLNSLNHIVSIAAGLISAFLGLYNIDKPVPYLSAYVTDNIFYTPPQYDDLMRRTLKESDYEKIYDRIDSISKDAEFIEKLKFVKEVIKSILTPFNPPFQNGLDEYKRLIFISVHNSGDASAKDIYIDYPEKVLVMIIDDKREKIEKPDALTRLNIPSIRQGGNYRVWAWAKSNDFDKNAIRIGNELQIAKIEYGDVHFGTSSYLASFYEDHERIIKTILLMFIFLIGSIVSYLLFYLGKQILKTE